MDVQGFEFDFNSFLMEFSPLDPNIVIIEGNIS